MAYEATPGAAAENDPTALGWQLQAQLTRFDDLASLRINTLFPSYGPDDIGRINEAYNAFNDLLAARINYDPAQKTMYGSDGLHCHRLEQDAVSFTTVIGYRFAELTLAVDNGAVTEYSKSSSFRPILHRTALKNGMIDTETYERLVHDDEVATTTSRPITFEDVLGTYAPGFLPRVLTKMHQAEVWYADCLEQGLDPFDDAAW